MPMVYWQVYGVTEGRRVLDMYLMRRTRYFWYFQGLWNYKEAVLDVYFWE